MKSILKLSVMGLLAVAMACGSASALAQTNLPSATEKQTPPEKKAAPVKKSQAGKKSTGEKKQRSIPFNGELTGLDQAAKTITVGKRTFEITSETRIYKGTKTPATLADGVVGEVVRGSYRKAEDGKLIAASVYFGPKTEGKAEDKTKPAEAKAKKPESPEKK